VCSPQPLLDLCTKNNWNYAKSMEPSSNTKKKGVHYICNDITRGREKFEIPVVNEVDDSPAPLDFVYVTSHVAGENVVLSNFGYFMPTSKDCGHDPVSLPHIELRCCSCTDNCRDATKCECMLRMGGPAYGLNGNLLVDKHGGIFECNQRCSCNVKRCKNRLVGLGPRLRLEVFRCENPAKGWGVRCTTNIFAGTYVADYIGEIMNEEEVENRGLGWGDDYLFNLDNWTRSAAIRKITSLELFQSRSLLPKELEMDVFAMTERDIVDADLNLSPDFLDMLREKGALQRARDIGQRLRNDPVTYLKYLDNVYNAGNGNNITTVESNGSNQQSSTQKSGQQQPPKNTRIGKRESWADLHKRAKKKIRRQAISVLSDRCILEAEETNNTFVVDAKWFGSVGRFLNHSCSPNLDKVTVYCETQDIRMPRLAFFANEFIPAYTELCYDYGYLAGNVEGKSRKCLCESINCRKTWY